MASAREVLEEMRDRVLGDNEPVADDEYLDRIGVEEQVEEVNEVIQEAIDHTDQAVEDLRRMTDDIRQGENRMRREPTRSEVYNGMTYGFGATAERNDFEDYHTRYLNQPAEYRQREQRYINWSNGDTEVRQPIPRVRQRTPFERHVQRWRQYTSDSVHDNVSQSKRRMLEFFGHEIEIMVYDLMESLENQGLQQEDILGTVGAMVCHFLEDVSDDMYMRYKVDVYQSPESFSQTVHLFIEVPNCEPLDRRILLDMWRRR